MSEIGKYPILTAVEERAIARRYAETRSAEDAKLLVVSNLRFVVKVAAAFRSYGLNMSDLVQEGNLGLMRAVEKFNPERDIRLISYAVWWIRAQIQSYVLRSWSLVRLGTTHAQRRLFFALARTQRELARGRSPQDAAPDADELANALNVRTTEVVEMQRRLSGHDFSLDTPLGDDGDATHLDQLGGDDLPADASYVEKQEAQAVRVDVSAALKRLDVRELFIVTERAMADEERSLKELGDELGISRERARQIEVRAKGKLRRVLRPAAERLQLTARRAHLPLAA